MSIKFIQLPICKLSAFINSSATGFDVSGFLYNDGTTKVAPTDIGDVCYATLEPRTEREELVSFTITSVTSAGVATLVVTRGLLQKSPYGTGGATFTHEAGSDFVISNNPALFNHFAAKDNAETITGDWKAPTPATSTSITNKTYVDTKVSKTGAETVAGVKTFTSPITIVDGVANTDAVSKLQSETYANTKVSKTGAETVAGVKTFSSAPKVPDAVAADEPMTKGQHDADAAASSAVASTTVRGSAKLNIAATNPSDPVVIGENFPINKVGADAVPANDVNRIVKLESDGKIDRYFLGNKVALPSIKDITVGATPVLVSAQNGDIVPAINSDTERVAKLGFLDTTITPTKPSFVNVSSFASALNGSITANIGTNRILLVRCYVPFSIVPPTTASWGASAMTLVETTIANDTYDTALAVFALPIGDSLVNETKTLTLDVASYVQAVTIDNIAQTDYLTNDLSAVTIDGVINTIDASSADLENGYSMRVAMGVATGGGGSTVTGAVGAGTSIYNGVEVASTKSVIAYALGNTKDTASNLAITMSSNTNTDTTATYIIGLRAYVVNTNDVQIYEKVSGFTGLIAGAMYYIGSTEGTLTVIKNAYPVGVAVSATEINILK